MGDWTRDEILTIRRQNEYLRTHGPYSVDGTVLGLEDLAGLFKIIKEYNTFDYGDEHESGSLRWHGKKVNWVIEYVHPLHQHLHDPLDPECEAILRVFVDQGDRRK